MANKTTTGSPERDADRLRKEEQEIRDRMDRREQERREAERRAEAERQKREGEARMHYIGWDPQTESRHTTLPPQILTIT